MNEFINCRTCGAYRIFFNIFKNNVGLLNILHQKVFSYVCYSKPNILTHFIRKHIEEFRVNPKKTTNKSELHYFGNYK